MVKIRKFLFMSLISSMIIGMSPSNVYASETINARVEARYSSNRISWNNVSGHDKYNVYKVGDDDTKLSLITTVTGQEYIDETAGVNTQERYVIKCNDDESIQSSIVKDSYKTGIEAVQGHARDETNNFHVSLSGGKEKFDGNTVLEFSHNISLLQELKKGTVLISFKPDEEKTVKNREILLNIKDKSAVTASGHYVNDSSNPANCISFMQGTKDIIRYDFSSTVKYSLEEAIAENDWTTYSLSVQTEGQNSYFKNRVNGEKKQTQFDYDHNGNYLLNFLNNSSITKLDYLTIGGAVNNGIKVARFKGEIAYVTITDEVMSDEETKAYTAAVTAKLNKNVSLGSQISNMFNKNADNTWLFVGGEEVQGSYDQVQGMRNYVSHFEEYIRWTKTSDIIERERYVMNAGRKGQTLTDINNNFESYKNEFNPKAMAYMVGKEDYSQDDVSGFKEALKTFINSSLSLKNNQGFAVIQKPHTVYNTQTDQVIQKYCQAVDDVVAEFTTAKNDQRIVVVDHDVTEDSLKNGLLNQSGHYKIGEQLSEATIETTSLYPCTKGIDFNLKNMNTVETYAQDIVPSIQSTDNSLEVEIPEYKDIQEWVYTLTLNDKTITDEVNHKFSISSLEKGTEYSLKIQSRDGKVQIRTMSGTIGNGQQASVKKQTLTTLQQQLKTKMENDDSLTWLFMGDSITHGAAYTLGQDTVAQSFEKYLKDDLKRSKDIVINTAVSGATVNGANEKDTDSSTLKHIQARLNDYNPDVISIMLGTNDIVRTREFYKTNLKTLVDKAKEKTDIVVLRSPLPTQWTDRDPKCKEFTEVMKEVAYERDCIFIDQYTPFYDIVSKYPYMYQDQYHIYGDNWAFTKGALHPGANGHLMMTHQFIEGIGILDEDTFIPNTFITMPFNTVKNTTTNLHFDKTKNSISFNTNQLSGVKDIKLTVQIGTKTYETVGDDGILTIDGLPSHQEYKVSVSGCSITKAELISYILQDIELTDKEQLNELIKECDKKDLSKYTTSSKEIFEEALASAKTVYKKTNPTIKEIDDAMTALNDAIEQLVKPSQLEVELDNDLLVDDIDQFKLMIRNDVKAQAIIKEASDKGQKIVVKLAFVEQRQRARMRIENKLGIYSLKALLMVDDEEVYEFDNTNTLIKVTIDIPDQLLNDEVKSFYLVKNIEDEYPKVAFERNGNKITFNGQVGSQYSFIYEKKEDGVEEPSQDDNKPNHGNTNTQVDNNKQHSLFVNKVQTSDEYQSELYIVLLAAALIIPIILKKKEGITNEKESND